MCKKKIITLAGLMLSLNSVAFNPNEALSIVNSKFHVYSDFARGGAVLNYDDTISPDYGDRLSPTSLMVTTNSDLFIGNVGGTDVDFDDCFLLDTVGREVTEIVFESYTTAGDNTSTGFNLYAGTPTAATDFGDLVSEAVTAAELGTNLSASVGVLSPGNYTICMLEGTPDQGFSLVVNSQLPDLIFANGFETLIQ